VANAPLGADAATFGDYANVPKLAVLKIGDKNSRPLGFTFDEIAVINQKLNELGTCVYVDGTAICHSEVFRVYFNAKGKHDAVVPAIVVWPREHFYGVRSTLTGKLNQRLVRANVVAVCDLL